MSVIAFSLLVHEKPLVILEQVINILSFNPNSIVVLHFNPIFKENDDLSKEELISILRNVKRVYINPNPVSVSIDNIIQGHLSNYHFIKKETFDYFCLIASNELFVHGGAEEFVSNYDYGCYHNKNEKWVYFEKMSQDKSLKNILMGEPKQKYYLSQVEGSFYSKEIFGEMVNTIEKHFEYRKQEMVYPREEMYFSSITGNYYSDRKRYDGCLCFINWKKGLFVSVKDIKRIMRSNSLFSAKRIDRQSNNYLREYIRRFATVSNNISNFKLVQPYIPNNHLNLFQIYVIDCFWRVAYFGRSVLVFLKRIFFKKRSKR